MKKPVSLLLIVITLLFSLTSCNAKSKLVRAWECPDSGEEIYLFEDGRGIVSYDGTDVQLSSWEVQKDVLIMNSDDSYYYFEPTKFKVTKNTLTLTKSNGREIIYRRMTNSKYDF